MLIRKMIPEDWNRVFEIYKQGIDSGKTTFSTKYPTWEEWDAGHNGVGTGLLKKLIEEAPDNGLWCLYSSIFSANEKSIKLHNKCGFRTIGYRERIAKDRFGNWTDTTLMEYRFPDELVKEV